VKWIIAQVDYSEILDKVQPLREKVVLLEDQAKETAQKGTKRFFDSCFICFALV